MLYINMYVQDVWLFCVDQEVSLQRFAWLEYGIELKFISEDMVVSKIHKDIWESPPLL